MGKKPKVKKVVPYNERERNMKILNFTLEISEMKMEFVLTPEVRKGFDEFVTLGKDYIACIDLPKFSRQLIINLINDKHQKTFINFKYIDPDEINKICHDVNCNDENCK
jgi:uncharacterized protein (DUF736 family)